MIGEFIIERIAGSMVGSSVAIVFKPGGGWFRLIQRFILGTIIGFIASPILLDYAGWQSSTDHWIASATICGLLGYLTLQIIFSEKTIQGLTNLRKK